MTTLQTLNSSILSLIILIIIYINEYRRSERAFVQYRLFIALVQTNIVLIIIDILGWVFNGLPGPPNLAYNKGFNLLLYIVEPMAPMLWVLYSNYQVFRDEQRIRRLNRVLLVFFYINALASVISLFTGWFFSVDEQNIYHRGDCFWVHVAYCYSLLIYAFYFILSNQKSLEKRQYFSLLLFFLPLSVGSMIQVFFYGVSYNWTGMMLSILIAYFNIQNRGLSTDYLTGAYNRRQLDGYIKDKIRNSSEEKTFSAILIDLNNFKLINDRLGHDAGDEALKNTVTILRKSLRENDFIARFGGDEFVVLMDINCRQTLEQTVSRIEGSVEEFNKDGRRPYRISLSMGYDIYDSKTKMKSNDFFKHIDTLMYNNKVLRGE